MKKYLALFSAIAIIFALSSCAKSDNDKEIINEDKYTKSEIDFTVPQSTEPILVDYPDEPELPTINITIPENSPADYKQHYVDFINNNQSKYAENRGNKSEVDPLYTYLDLDNDGTDELIYFIKFIDLNMANLYFFDYIDGNVVEIYGTDYCGNYRTSEQFRVFERDGKYYVVKTCYDGQYSFLKTVYRYDGNDLIVLYSITGSYYNSEFYYSDSGADPFNGRSDEFIQISEEEFDDLKEQMNNIGVSVYNSNEIFEQY